MKTRGPLLWRWSLRDLRARWMQVLGIALVIALGVSVFSGMSSLTPWREEAADKSYAMLDMFDLKLELTEGSYLEAERLAQAIREIPHADWITGLDLRLSFPTTVDASTPDETVLISGRIIGIGVGGDKPEVGKLHVTAGRGLDADDAGAMVCVAEHNFAEYYDVTPGERSIHIGGEKTLQVVGTGLSPEHFYVMEEGAGALGVMAQDRYALLFVPLETAQTLAELPGMVNQALITVPAGVDEADLDQLKSELRAAADQAFPQVGLELEKRSENAVYQYMYDEIASNQEMYDTFGVILLLGAAFGAFILTSRVVDAQRREIGINMALGVAPRRIARRYLLFGLQIALLGTLIGVGLSLLVNQAMGQTMLDLLPLPYFEMPFQVDIFVQGMVIGVLVPLLAIVYPIWRAVRVTPVDAIQTGYLVSKGGGLASSLARAPLPGSSLAQMPVRNLLRGLRRTLMTVLGLSTALIVLIIFIGYVDSFNEMMDAGRREAAQDAPNRLQVQLDDFYAREDPLVSRFTDHPEVTQVVPEIVLGGKLIGDQTFDVKIRLLDLDNDLWTPTVERGGTTAEGSGVLINAKAARDLGVDVGDRVTLRHPYRESQHTWRMVETPVQVMGIHPDLLRISVYMDIREAGIMNATGWVNNLQLNPTPGTDVNRLRFDLSQLEGVAAVQQPTATVDTLQDMVAQFTEIYLGVELVVLVMAFLIAYNTTRSNIDERRREVATMFAFGTRVRTVIRMAITENLITGVLSTAAGILLGWWALNAVLVERLGSVTPELNPIITVYPATFGWVVFIGVVVVGLTPIFMVRRLTRMDIPSTLRVVE